MERTLTLALLAALLSMQASAQNLLTNAGFETATVGVPLGTPLPFYPTALDGWTAVNTDGEFVLGAAQAHSGTGFLSMLENGGQNPGAPWIGVSAAGGFDRGGQVVNVLPNTEYELVYWYRAGDGSRYGYGAGNALVQAEEISPAFASLASALSVATPVWQQGSLVFVTGPSTSQIIVLFSATGTGTTDTWYDDVDLHETSGKGSSVAENGAGAGWLLDANSGTLSLLRGNLTNGQVQLFNAAGAAVSVPTAVQSDRCVLDIGGLANGTYTASANSSNGRRVFRFVLAR